MIRTALTMLVIFTVLTGVAYPLIVTGLAQLLFPYQANGCLIEREGRVIGSELIGQPFTDEGHFWSRPSAVNYNAASSGASNRGVLHPDLLTAVDEHAQRLREANPGTQTSIPVDLVTASASGLDPHISPAAAMYQVPRVARARGIEEISVHQLVLRHTHERWQGILGEPAVNVLMLNLALDELQTMPTK